MAIAFARISIHSRSQGHSAVASAAYRAGQCLYDERTGETHDFTNRADVIYDAVLLPEGAPSTYERREWLWNAAEKAEKRKDSQVAKDVILALPRELDTSQHIELARQFAQDHFVNHGVAVDLAIHDHGDGNPHAHLYVTTRRLGPLGFDKYKARDLNPSFANGQHGKGFVCEDEAWGARWRAFQNTFFETHQLSVEVDANHLVPQRHEGKIRGDSWHYLQEENQLRREASIELTVNSPEAVLNQLSHQQSIISERDIAKIIHKNTDTAEQFQQALTNVKAHPDLITLGLGDDGRQYYTTKANYTRETHMASQADSLSRTASMVASPQNIQQTIDRFQLNHGQAQALQHIAEGAGMTAIIGRAGSGKSYLMKAAKALWDDAGFKIYGMAVSGIAAHGLEQESGISSQTIAYYRQRLTHGHLDLDENSIVVMDEAGMTDANDMAMVVDAVSRAKARLVLVGDYDQLQPVGPGAPLRALVEQIGFSELDEIMRQRDAGDREATYALAKGQIEQGLSHYQAKGAIHFAEDDALTTALIHDWWQHAQGSQLSDTIMMASRHRDVRQLNLAARAYLQQVNYFASHPITYQQQSGTIDIAVGERLLFLKNDRTLGVHNGDFGTVTQLTPTTITVQLDGKAQRTIAFEPKEYDAFQHGYAATIHKLQGTTYQHSFVYIAGHMWDRFLTYVSLSRHKASLKLYVNQADYQDYSALSHALGRDRHLDTVLNWPFSFAWRRGFDPETLAGRYAKAVLNITDKAHDIWLFIRDKQAYQLKQQQRQRTQLRQQATVVADYADLNPLIWQQRRELKAQLGKKPLAVHPQFMAYQALVMKKNQLAATIMAEPSRYEKALALNHLSIEQLTRDQQQTYLDTLAEHYVIAYAQHRHRILPAIADTLFPHQSTTYHALVYYAKKHHVSRTLLLRQLQQDYLTAQWPALKQANPTLSEANRAEVNAYWLATKQYQARWQLIKQHGGPTRQSPQQAAATHALGVARDKLGAQLYQQYTALSPLLALYGITTNHLAQADERYHARALVKRFSELPEGLLKDNLAYRIKTEKSLYYAYIREFTVDWKAIHLGHWRYQQRQHPLSRQTHLVKTIKQYQSLCRQAAHTWQRVTAEHRHPQAAKSHENTQQLAGYLTRQRNQLAQQLSDALVDNQALFKHHRVNLERLAQHLHQQRRDDFVALYCQETRPVHQHAMASFIFQHRQHYRLALRLHHVDYAQLRRHAYHHEHLRYQATLPQHDKAVYRLLVEYDRKQQASAMAWAKVRHAKQHSTTPHEHDYHQASHLSQQRNALAETLLTHLHQQGGFELLPRFGLEHEALIKQAAQHHCYQRVLAYQQTHHPFEKAQLAHAILTNKTHYPFVYGQKLCWTSLKRAQLNYLRLQHQRHKTSETNQWQMIQRYQQAVIDAGIAWSQYFKAKDTLSPPPKSMLAFCQALNKTRNALAYQIILNAKAMHHALAIAPLSLEKLEKHARAYHQGLSHPSRSMKTPDKLRSTPQPSVSYTQKTAEPSTEVSPYSSYPVLNAKLVERSLEFYESVIGESGKRQGHTLRFGQKGSLSITLTGEHAGTWYSFESGTGGGPIQFLMDPTVGLGLSYREAMEEAARFTGHQHNQPMKPRTLKPNTGMSPPTTPTADDLNKQKNARYYYDSAQPIAGSLGETYLRDVRGISGDISAFKFHPHIKDTQVLANGQTITQYFPGIVVPAFNEHDQLTGTQTILLDPTTARKMSADKVGAVKRSRGVIKGSVTPLRQTTSSQVVLAEGPETGASLLAALPEANIYVTLGNIRHAAELGWLAHQHHTKTLYFAGDKDSNPQAEMALIDVAKQLKTTHNIDCFVAYPSLPGQQKVDFNDVLLSKGVDDVKRQISQFQLIHVPTVEKPLDDNTFNQHLDRLTQQSLSADIKPVNDLPAPTPLLADPCIEWEKLANIKHPTLHWVIKYKSLYDNTNEPEKRLSIHEKVDKLLHKINDNPYLQEKIAAIEPHFLRHINNEPHHDINSSWWKDPKLNTEWKQLKTLSLEKINWLCTYYDKLQVCDDPKQHIKLEKNINRLAVSLMRDKQCKQQLTSKAPNIMEKMQAYAKHHQHQHHHDRER